MQLTPAEVAFPCSWQANSRTMSSECYQRAAVDVVSLVNFMNKNVYRGTPDHLQNLAGTTCPIDLPIQWHQPGFSRLCSSQRCERFNIRFRVSKRRMISFRCTWRTPIEKPQQPGHHHLQVMCLQQSVKRRSTELNGLSAGIESSDSKSTSLSAKLTNATSNEEISCVSFLFVKKSWRNSPTS